MGDVEEDEKVVTLQRRQSIKLADKAMERERARQTRTTKDVITTSIIFALSAVALAALLAITFEETASSLFSPPPPPPPPPKLFGLF